MKLAKVESSVNEILTYWYHSLTECWDHEEVMRNAGYRYIWGSSGYDKEFGNYVECIYEREVSCEPVYEDLLEYLLENSRPFTKEESEAYSASLKKLFKPTGRNLFKKEDTDD